MLNLSLSSTQAYSLQNPKPLFTSFSKTPQKSLWTIKFRNPIYRKPALKCQFSDQQQQQQRPNSSYNSEGTPRVYIGHSIYKGKGVLTVQPLAPEFAPLDSGAFKLAREGSVLLQFAPAASVRQYDWSRKQVFSLSVAEIGSLLSLGAKEACEFFHDPFIGRSDEGTVRKILKVEPLPDGSGHFFNLSVQNKLINMDESIYIPVTKGEFATLVSLLNFVAPYLLGWNTFTDSIKPEYTSNLDNASSSYGADLEWSR